ncbi:TonB-dependent receptor [Pseudoflavitalea sp. G-6-1-2]|uniref:TonB-dependent receptor plug domain-containing protein n=1 Tax=Pseudoflavitalea sp. G-6-1-2 TaxID=2728841 RepID=UPI00146B72CD|nr:TonB-dependent receptor [Pseudoflavitalea sp. G-6-1-2]NML20111.1 TonB-dependent receptor [Pseudoflavitalea sp. G-6-1-2]
MKTRLTFTLSLLFGNLLYGQSVVDTIKNMDTVTVSRQKQLINGVNRLTLSVKQIEAIPKIMGIADPLKSIRFLPGFGNGGDANTGAQYRGLPSGSNGYFYNGVLVHNPSHLFGLFPLFNNNVVEDLKFYTGVVPGKYFGKLSGYIDINSNWQVRDTTLIKAEASLAHLGVGARIERDSVQMVEIFWRNTFMNKTLWPVLSKSGKDLESMKYDLFDLNINAKRIFNKSELKAFFYLGGDKAMFDLYEKRAKNSMDWGNLVIGMTHTADLRRYIKWENNIGYSKYKTRVAFDLFGEEFALTNHQNTLSISSTLAYRKSRRSVETGFLYMLDDLGTTLQNEGQADQSGSNIRYKSNQQLFKYFLNAKSPLSEKIELEGSLNLSTVSAVEPPFIINPALSVSWLMNARNTFFYSLSMAYQPTHQVGLTNINLPVDYVIHANRNLSVSKIREVSGGYRHAGSRIEFSIDVYYRWLSDLKEFNGNIISLNKGDDITSEIENGKGVTYGADFFVRLTTPRNYFTVNYSYSRSFRKFDAINNGEWYKYIYDRPHNLSIVNSYKISPKISFSVSFMYNSGSAYTPTVGMFYFGNSVLAEYGSKNSNRMDAYHRLDAGIDLLLKKTSKCRQTLGISIINIYNHSNPIYIYQSYDRDYFEKNNAFKMIQKDGPNLPLLPALTYSLEIL